MLKKGDKIMYRYNSRSKWQEGRVWKVDSRGKRSIPVEKYMAGNVINWPEVLKMCDGLPSGEMIARNVTNWYFQYWVTPENVKKITNKTPE